MHFSHHLSLSVPSYFIFLFLLASANVLHFKMPPILTESILVRHIKCHRIVVYAVFLWPDCRKHCIPTASLPLFIYTQHVYVFVFISCAFFCRSKLWKKTEAGRNPSGFDQVKITKFLLKLWRLIKLSSFKTNDTSQSNPQSCLFPFNAVVVI